MNAAAGLRPRVIGGGRSRVGRHRPLSPARASGRVVRRDRRHAPVWRSRFDGPLAPLPFDDAPEGPLPATRGSDIAGFWNGTGPAEDALFAMFGTFVHDGRLETGSPDVAPVQLGASDDHAHLTGRHRVERDPRSAAKAVTGARVVVGHVAVDRRGVTWRSSAKPPGRPGRLGCDSAPLIPGCIPASMSRAGCARPSRPSGSRRCTVRR